MSYPHTNSLFFQLRRRTLSTDPRFHAQHRSYSSARHPVVVTPYRRCRHRTTATPACPSRFAFFPPKYLELNNPTSSLRSHAFVEFRSQHDAEDAYYDMCAASALPLSIPLPLHLAVGTAATSKGLA